MCYANDIPCLRRRNVRPPANANANANVAGNVDDTRRIVALRIRPHPEGRMKRWGAAIRDGRVGLWSLALAVAGPASLHMAERTFLRPAHLRAEQFRLNEALLDPDWFMDSKLAIANLVISLCCRFGWAEGGHGGVVRRPNPAKLVAAWAGYVISSVAWDPIVLGLGAIKLGLLASGVRLGLQGAIAWMLVDLDLDASLGVLACGFWSIATLIINVDLLRYGLTS